MKNIAGHLFLAGAFILAGSSVIAARFVCDKLGAFTIAAISLFFAVCGLLPLCAKNLLGSFRALKPKDYLMLILQAMFGIFLFRMFFVFGLQKTSAAEAGLLTGATPAATAILACIFLRERLNKPVLAGIISTTAGVVLLQGAINADRLFIHFWGNLLVLAAAVCESTFNILSKVFSRKANDSGLQRINPLVQTLIVSFFAFLMCFAAMWFENPITRIASIGSIDWIALLWYGLIVTALAFVFWYAGINRCSASTAAAFSGLMPFTSFLLSVLLLKEQSAWQQWLGGFFVIMGMLMIGIQSKKEKALVAIDPD